MGVRFSMASGAILASFLVSVGHADDSQFGDLDFTRMTKPQEQFFWRRLKSLAFEEAVITYCGQPDDFETRAKQGIQSCVTAEALNRADAVYRSELKTSLGEIRQRKASCSAKPDSVRGWLGVDIGPVKKDIADGLSGKLAPGALVAKALDDSPAAAAGVQAGDVITSVNGETIDDAKALSAKIGRLAPGASVQLGVQRDGAGRTLSAKLGAMAFDRQGQATVDMPALVESSRKDLKYVSDEVTEMCHRCRTSIWAMFCH